MKKWSIRIIATLALVFALAFVFLRTPDIDAQVLKTKYSNQYSKFVETDAAIVHYRDQGSKAAKTILLIHGSNSSLQTWDKVADALDDKYRVISVDTLGHGLTGPSKKHDYSAKAFISAINAVLDKENIKDAVWVGNSMGGWLVWRAALESPDRVNSLVLVDASGAITTEKIKPYIGAKLAANPIGKLLLTSISPKFLVAKSLKQSVGDEAQVSDALVTRYWELLRYPGNRQAMIERASTSREDDVWNRVQEIKKPTLIIWGDKDNVIPIGHANAFKQKITGAELVIMKNSGHLPMEENPPEFVKHLEEWLDKPHQ